MGAVARRAPLSAWRRWSEPSRQAAITTARSSDAVRATTGLVSKDISCQDGEAASSVWRSAPHGEIAHICPQRWARRDMTLRESFGSERSQGIELGIYFVSGRF